MPNAASPLKPLTPKRFTRNPPLQKARTVLVCAGDSITHGLVNPNYVKPLQERLASRRVQVINAGVSGDLAVNLHNRIDAIVACRPDVVTVLIGTNDVAAQIDARWRRGYVRQKRLTEP